MPKQSPIPGDIDKPFWDACNREVLVVQNCKSCDRMQHPPKEKCGGCNSSDNLEWREMSGKRTISPYIVGHDTPVTILQAEQPFNVAVVKLDEDPGITMLSHLPGTATDAVPIGAKVQVEFETTPATGQKVPEWRVVG